MAKEVDMSQRTIIKIVDNLRELCVKFYRNHPIQLGEDGCVVEADTAIFAKYHIGRRPARELWMFGLADSGFNSSWVALFLVPNRTTNTLLHIFLIFNKNSTEVIFISACIFSFLILSTLKRRKH